MSDAVIIGILALGCLLGAILSMWQDNKIKKLEIENAVLKTKLENQSK